MSAPALEAIALEKTYANGVRALKGVSLQVAEGDFFALLGPNGAGKSTLIGIAASLVNPSAGQVKIFGHDLSARRGTALSMMGIVPQELNFNQFEKPFDIVVNQAGFYGIPRAVAIARAEEYLKALSLWEKAFQPARTLSGGMKRRLMIARAMVNRPKLLILDEPTAGVDIEIRRSMWKFVNEINQAGTTVILTTHYLEEAEQLCRHVAIIDKGLIVENTTIKKLLSKLDVETFIFDLAEPLEKPLSLDNIVIHVIDPSTLEVEQPKAMDLNYLFGYFTAQGVKVKSMRNKTNRLEELFVRLVNQTPALEV